MRVAYADPPYPGQSYRHYRGGVIPVWRGQAAAVLVGRAQKHSKNLLGSPPERLRDKSKGGR